MKLFSRHAFHLFPRLGRQSSAQGFVAFTLALLVGWLPVGFARADEYDDVSSLMRSGRMADALRQADQYLTTRPRDPQMRFLKGMIQRETGQVVQARITFTALTEDFPELPEPHNNLAALLAADGEFEKARSALQMAVKANPEYAIAHENLGDIYARLALQAYARSRQLDASNLKISPKIRAMQQLFEPQSPAAAASPSSPTPSSSAKGNTQ
jgi:tetratricopeptide (TPR) repeat protein